MTADPGRRPIQEAERPDLLALARLLSEARRAAGLTRPQVATAAALSVRHIQRLEEAQRRTRASTLERLAVALEPSGADVLLTRLIDAAGSSLAPESAFAERVERRRGRRQRRSRNSALPVRGEDLSDLASTVSTKMPMEHSQRVYVDPTAKGKEREVSITTHDTSVAIEECTQEQGQQMLEDAAQSRFGLSWADFFAAYTAGEYRDTDVARVAEELAFLARFAG